ncbi:MAG: hypothetical protein S4CHLAM102_06820 [Chlamydiia bacterium]|nr:hypothetical protein [Chlamydiia bacterium]
MIVGGSDPSQDIDLFDFETGDGAPFNPLDLFDDQVFPGEWSGFSLEGRAESLSDPLSSEMGSDESMSPFRGEIEAHREELMELARNGNSVEVAKRLVNLTTMFEPEVELISELSSECYRRLVFSTVETDLPKAVALLPLFPSFDSEKVKKNRLLSVTRVIVEMVKQSQLEEAKALLSHIPSGLPPSVAKQVFLAKEEICQAYIARGQIDDALVMYHEVGRHPLPDRVKNEYVLGQVRLLENLIPALYREGNTDQIAHLLHLDQPSNAQLEVLLKIAMKPAMAGDFRELDYYLSLLTPEFFAQNTYQVGLIYYQAVHAAAGLGDEDRARGYLERVDRTNPILGALYPRMEEEVAILEND